MQHIITRYGFYYAALLCVGFFLSYLIFGNDPDNYSKSEALGYSIMLFTSVVVVLAVRAAKVKQNGQLSFLNGLGIGLGVSAIGAFAFAVYNWVYVAWVHPEFISEYVLYHETQIRESQLPEAMMQQQLSELAAYSDMMSNPLLMAVLMFFTVFAIGALFGLCAALGFRDKATPPA